MSDHEKKPDFLAFDRFRTIWERTKRKTGWSIQSIPFVWYPHCHGQDSFPDSWPVHHGGVFLNLFLTKITEAWHVEVGRCTMVLRCTIQVLNSEIKALAFSRCKPWISDTTLRKPGLSTDMLLQNDHWVSTRMGHPKIQVVDHHLPGSSGKQNGPKKVYPPI